MTACCFSNLLKGWTECIKAKGTDLEKPREVAYGQNSGKFQMQRFQLCYPCEALDSILIIDAQYSCHWCVAVGTEYCQPRNLSRGLGIQSFYGDSIMLGECLIMWLILVSCPSRGQPDPKPHPESQGCTILSHPRFCGKERYCCQALQSKGLKITFQKLRTKARPLFGPS